MSSWFLKIHWSSNAGDNQLWDKWWSHHSDHKQEMKSACSNSHRKSKCFSSSEVQKSHCQWQNSSVLNEDDWKMREWIWFVIYNEFSHENEMSSDHL